jgi:hypothetical protein
MIICLSLLEAFRPQPTPSWQQGRELVCEAIQLTAIGHGPRHQWCESCSCFTTIGCRDTDNGFAP